MLHDDDLGLERLGDRRRIICWPGNVATADVIVGRRQAAASARRRTALERNGRQTYALT
jgi:hypothetical protein